MILRSHVHRPRDHVHILYSFPQTVPFPLMPHLTAITNPTTHCNINISHLTISLNQTMKNYARYVGIDLIVELGTRIEKARKETNDQGLGAVKWGGIGQIISQDIQIPTTLHTSKRLFMLTPNGRKPAHRITADTRAVSVLCDDQDCNAHLITSLGIPLDQHRNLRGDAPECHGKWQ